MIGQYKAWGTWRSLWVRLVALMDVYLILNDWISLAYLIFLFCTLQNFLPLIQAIMVIWAFQLLVRWHGWGPVGSGAAWVGSGRRGRGASGTACDRCRGVH